MTGANAANLAVVVGLIALAAIVYRAWLQPPTTRIRPMPTELTEADEEQLLTDLAALDDLDTHLDGYASQIASLYEPGGLTIQHPGFARLLAAVRDEQQKETR